MSKTTKMSEQRIKRRRQIRYRLTLAGAAFFAMLILTGLLVLRAVNRNEIVFSAKDGETITVEYGSVEPEPVKAWYKGTLIHREGTEIPVAVIGSYDMNKLGSYKISYSASRDGHTKTISRTIVVEDQQSPELKLVSVPGHYTSPGHEYEEEGYSAFDNYDGDLTDKVHKSQRGDVILYTVTDSNGNTAMAERKIEYKDVTAPEIKLKGKKIVRVAINGKYKEKGCTAIDDCDGDLTEQVKVKGKVNTKKAGEYPVSYTVADSAGNVGRAVRTVRVTDMTAPTITLKGDEIVYVELGAQYEDPGCEATDNLDGDLSALVKTGDGPDTTKGGIYEVSYSVKDSSDNEATAKRTVVVINRQVTSDNVGQGGTSQGAGGTQGTTAGNAGTQGTTAGNAGAQGITAGDAGTQGITAGNAGTQGTSAGNAGGQGITAGNAGGQGTSAGNTGTQGTSAGNAGAQGTTATEQGGEADGTQRSVSAVSNTGDKIVYLTFDDGPGKYTQKLLDVLDQYNVKATFFVTNQYPEYQELIKAEHEKGHTVALHSYSHDYASIYASQEAFYKDLQKMSDVCYEQADIRPTIIRFPGGSSNTVSAHYRNGIMTELTESLGLKGYQYCDWNVTSGDAGETTDTSKVAENVIEGIQKNKVSVVLQHDVKEFSVNAVEKIINWGLANGYTFLPMDTSMTMVHHTVNN